jgi:hypothetical protein
MSGKKSRSERNEAIKLAREYAYREGKVKNPYAGICSRRERIFNKYYEQFRSKVDWFDSF